LINYTIINRFHVWPGDALYSVNKRFLSDLNLGGNDPEIIIQFIIQAHLIVIKISVEYFESERRYHYTTPKSYLELISLFESMLDYTPNSFINIVQHFSKCLLMLQKSSQDVEIMKKKLEKQTKIVAEKK
jgi:dynein heavy chain